MRWLLVLVVVPRLAVAGVPSPGPLASVHAAIDDECARCHTSGKYLAASLCLGCHEELEGEVGAGLGLHGRNYQGKPCEDCHVDHRGRGGKLIAWPGGAMDKLDHALTGYPLTGGHIGVACAKCHTANTFLGTRTSCNACHADPHGGRFSANCATCHDPIAWKHWHPEYFDHKLARFALTGKHVTVPCAKCHGVPAKWAPVASGACETCHKDPHRGQFKPKACEGCHDPTGWQGATVQGNHPKISLANGHAKVACASCHDRGNDRPPSRGSTCASCHPAVHVARFGTACEDCHASIKWLGLPDAIGRAAHDRTRYPLGGAHGQVACAKCHAGNRYRNLTFDACTACHADAHHGEFHADCATCHGVTGWIPTTFGVAQHASYKLDGRHAATPCGKCHPGARPRLSWQVFGKDCLDCHENPHGTQFAKQLIAGGCAGCHDTASWHAKVDHTSWPLTGAHTRTACDACHGKHEPGAAPTTFRGIARDCEGCHDDVHAGQFRQTAPARRCADCHATETWKSPAFDHAKTRYPLEGVHRSLACEQCHANTTLRDGSSAVRWRLGYIRCKDCHADPHAAVGVARAGKLAMRGGGELDCNGCHTAASWKLAGGAGAGFDHDRTGFPLRGGHLQASCGACHAGAKPPQTCEGCHRDPHQGRMDGACAECHTQLAWSDTAALEQHRRTRMPLTGKHAVIACVACHTRQAERGYTDLPVDCYACHADEYHSPSTVPNHDRNPSVWVRDCAKCHQSAAWKPALSPPATPRRDHDAWFQLSTGSHRDADCASCHVTPRPTRAVRCDGCHDAGSLRGQHRAVVAVSSAACLRCHPRGARR